jgi:preprotein translocase subunit Sss1
MLLVRQPNRRLAAVVRTADRIDYWVRRRVHATHLVGSNLWPAEDRFYRFRMSGASHSKLFPAGDRSAWLSIGNGLRAQYDALAAPMPPHIAALVEQLETVNRVTMYAQKPHWLDYDPLALAVLVIGIAIIELLVLII